MDGTGRLAEAEVFERTATYSIKHIQRRTKTYLAERGYLPELFPSILPGLHFCVLGWRRAQLIGLYHDGGRQRGFLLRSID